MGTLGGKGLKAAQNLVVEHYVRYFYTIFQFLRRLKPWLQSTLKEFLTYFPIYGDSKLVCRAL